MKRGDFGIAFRPTPRYKAKPWVLQLVKATGNVTAGRYASQEEAEAARDRLSQPSIFSKEQS